MDQSKVLITGSNGQLGSALKLKYPAALFTDSSELDISNKDKVDAYDWSKIEVIINAAAYTNVDGAETKEGRISAWSINAQGVANLSKVARDHNITLIHISSEYVFDGTVTPHLEDEPFSPLGVYGQSKAAGDLVVSTLPKHYILRTSWVIGEGKNFIRTMLGLAKNGVNPTVVKDQIGRLTFTSTLADAIDFLINNNANYGTYNVSCSGEPVSWADITRKTYKYAALGNEVGETTTKEYFASKPGYAPRPLNSVLSLDKIEDTGFKPKDWQQELNDYVKKEINI